MEGLRRQLGSLAMCSRYWESCCHFFCAWGPVSSKAPAMLIAADPIARAKDWGCKGGVVRSAVQCGGGACFSRCLWTSRQASIELINDAWISARTAGPV